MKEQGTNKLIGGGKRVTKSSFLVEWRLQIEDRNKNMKQTMIVSTVKTPGIYSVEMDSGSNLNKTLSDYKNKTKSIHMLF